MCVYDASCEEQIDYILSQEVTPVIQAEEIALFEPMQETHLYLRTVGIEPGVSRLEKRVWGSRIVANLIKIIIELGKRGIDIRTITARSETPMAYGS